MICGGGRDAQWEPCRTCLHSVPPGLKPGTREVTSWARSKFLGLWILLDILTQRPPPAQDKACEQGQDEAAPTVRLFQGRGTWRSSGGISAVKGNLETMVVNPLLRQKRKLSPERGRGCSKATQPVAAALKLTPPPLPPSPRWLPLGSTVALHTHSQSQEMTFRDPSAFPRQNCQSFIAPEVLLVGFRKNSTSQALKMAAPPGERSGGEVWSRPLDICLCHRLVSWPFCSTVSSSQQASFPSAHENLQFIQPHSPDVHKEMDFQI